jgi:hypothetical protein
MDPILGILLMCVAGAAAIVAGVFLMLGAASALLATGTFFLISAALLTRGLPARG